MNLNGERLGGAEHFKQERQFAETLCNLVAEQGGLVAVNDLAQRVRATVSVENLRTALRMRAHPQLCHWQVVRVGDTIKFR